MAPIDSYPRTLCAILHADIAGYSRLIGDDEDTTHRRVIGFLQLIKASVEAQRGEVIHYAGDSVLARFSAVLDSLSCAADIQQRISAENADLPESRKVQFRIGVNVGDIIEGGVGISGNGVNVAARLENLADPGGICISDAVRTAISQKVPLEFEFMGEQLVKNIAEPLRAYRVLMPSQQAVRDWVARTRRGVGITLSRRDSRGARAEHQYVGVVREALLLDRTEQWRTVTERLRGRRSTLFLIHGERRQNLELFVARILHFVNEEVPEPQHLTKHIPFVESYRKPTSSNAWELRLRNAFDVDGRALDLVRDETRHQPVLLIVGDIPLGIDELENDTGIAALEGFLTGPLASIIAQARSDFLVHSLIAVPYDEEERWLFDRLHAAVKRSAENANFVVQDVELTQVTWQHVKHYLDRMEDGKPPAFIYDRIERLYAALDVNSMSFDQLAREIGKELPQSSARGALR